MATKQKRCVGVDLGSHTVRVAEVSLTRNGAVVNRLAEAELELGPAVPLEERETKISRVLRDVLRKSKIGGRQAVFSVSGQQTFLRRLTGLPKTSEQRLARIVENEADNLVPFPPDQSLRRSQMGEEEEEVEVLLAAMKREHVDSFMRIVSRTGLKAQKISVAPLALHNFYRFCETPFVSPEAKKREARKKTRKEAEPEEEKDEKSKTGKGEEKDKKDKDAKKKDEGGKKKGFSLGGLFAKKASKKTDKGKKGKAGAAEDEAAGDEVEAEAEAPPEEDVFREVVAYVNIGAHTMDLSIPKHEGELHYGFSRSVPLAGDEMTLAIQRAKGLDSFAEAEETKRSRVAVIDPDTPEDEAPAGVDWEASLAATGVVDRMLIELRRSLDFYISQPDGMAVDRIALSGGQVTMPGLREYLEERLAIDVTITTEPPGESLTMGKGELPALHPYLVAVGLALEGLGYSELDIDFLPEQFQAVRTFKKKAPLVAVMAGCVVGMVAVSSQVGTQSASMYNNAAGEGQSRLGTLKRDDYDQKYREAVAAQKAANQEYDNLRKAFEGLKRDFWFDKMLVIERLKPADVTISYLELGGLGKITIEAYSKNPGSAADFAEALKAEPDLARVVQLLVTPRPGNSPLFDGQVYWFRVGMLIKKDARAVTPPPVPIDGTRARTTSRPRRPEAEDDMMLEDEEFIGPDEEEGDLMFNPRGRRPRRR